MRIVIVLMILVASFTACNNKDSVPSGILPKDKMQAVLWDVMQAESYTNFYIRKDSSKNLVLENAKLQEKVFNIHHVSKDDFYKSYNYYKEHTSLLLTLLDSMTAQENRKESERIAINTKATARADSIKMRMAKVADSIKSGGIKNKVLLLKEKRVKATDSIKVKGKHKKHLTTKHKIIPAKIN